MPWVPTTDFEEEVVNLQPHHDFIYGALSEPQFSYPRPKSHTDYAAKKKQQDKEQQKQYEATGQFNEKLRLIQLVQRIAKTKPLGEQPSIDDWDDHTTIEQETVGMMRYCGMSASVDKPLSQTVTIASHPVQNSIKVVQNGRRKVALFFDDNVFKLQEKVTDTSSSGFESCNNSGFENGVNDSFASELESDTSFNTYSSSVSTNSFNTAGDSISTTSTSIKSPSKYLKKKCLTPYEKLLEDTSLLSLDSSTSRSCNSSINENCDSFKTAKDGSSWTPLFEDDDILRQKKNWPALGSKDCVGNLKPYDDDNSDIFNSPDDISDETTKNVKRENFLNRFIKSDDDTVTTSEKISPPPAPLTYASITKKPKVHINTSEKKDKKPKSMDFPPFYTARKMYALKRNVK